MKLTNPNSDIFIPDAAQVTEALSRTTHLAIVAHQDDIEIMAYHGVAACFGQPASWFTGVVVTDGAGSARSGLYAEYSDEQMKQVRILEQRKAAYIGEYSCQFQLGYSSAAVKDPANRDVPAELSTILSAARPRTVYLHNLADKHETHIGVSMHAIAALRSLAADQRPAKVYGCEVWRDLDWMPDAHKIPLAVSDRENIGAALVAVFDSQITGGKRYDLATPGRRLANATYFIPRATDTEKAITFAMDLTPLILDPQLSPLTYVTNYIDEFRKDVSAKIGRYL